MSVELAQSAFDRTAVDRLSSALREPDWMRQRRFEGLLGFDELPLPSGRQLDWSKLDLATLTPSRELAVKQTCLPDDLVKRGVIFCDLQTALRDHAALLEEYFMTCGVPVRDNKFAALHAAFWTNGSLLYVPKEVEIEIPLRAEWFAAGRNAGHFGHTLVIADQHAKLTYVDRYQSDTDEGAGLFAGVTELLLGEGANVVYIADQRWGRHVWDVSTCRAVLQNDASLTWLNVGLGSVLTKNRIETILTGSGSSTEMLGVTLAQPGQAIYYDTLQDHRVPYTKSDLQFKAALKERARTVYEGTIKVRPKAQKTDAYQASRNLLLEKNSRADATPTLEIEANDVRCTHGATVGPVDADQLFYLRSRGLTRTDAVRLLVAGFFDQPLAYIPNDALREELRQSLDQALTTG